MHVERSFHPADLARGIGYAFKGFALLRKYPGLARYWSIPIALTFAALVAGAVLAFRYHDDVLSLVWRAPGGSGWSAGLLSALYWLTRQLTLLIGLAVMTLVCVLVSSVIAAPFNEALSEAIEERETGRGAAPLGFGRMLRELGRSLGIELLKLSAFVLVMGPLFLVSWLVPGIGHLIYLGVGGLLTCSYFAFDYIDWPASRRGWGARARIGLFARRPLLMLGFGLAVWGCLLVPLISLAFMPIAVAGGTRLFLDLEEESQRRAHS